MADKKLYHHDQCPVCHKPFDGARNQKYCNSQVCKDFGNKKVGKLKKRRRDRTLNRQFHLEWVRRHREDRAKFFSQTKLLVCQDHGLQLLRGMKQSLEYGLDSPSSVLKLLEEFMSTLLLQKDLEVHHKDGDFRNGDITNMDGLCTVCHNKAESLLRKAGKPSDGPVELRSEDASLAKVETVTTTANG